MGDNPVKAEVQNFDKGKLRKTETKESNPLPTQKVIEEEKKANQDEKCT